jgi:hypothetical protein
MTSLKPLLAASLLALSATTSASAALSAEQESTLYQVFMAHVGSATLSFTPAQDGCAKFEKFRDGLAPYDGKYTKFWTDLHAQAADPSVGALSGDQQIAYWHKLVCDDKTAIVIWIMQKDEAPVVVIPPTPPEASTEDEVDPNDRIATKLKFDSNLDFAFKSGNIENYLHVDASAALSYNVTPRNIISISGDYGKESDSEVDTRDGTLFYNYLLNEHWAVFTTAAYAHNGARGLQTGEEAFGGVIWSKFPISELNDHYLAFSAGLGDRYNQYKIEGPNSVSDATFSSRVKYEKTITASVKFMGDVFFQSVLYGPRMPGDPSRAIDFGNNRVLAHLKLQFGKDDGFHFDIGYMFDRWEFQPVNTKKIDQAITAGIGYGIFKGRKRSSIFHGTPSSR